MPLPSILKNFEVRRGPWNSQYDMNVGIEHRDTTLGRTIMSLSDVNDSYNLRNFWDLKALKVIMG